jgi:hypothetical protein
LAAADITGEDDEVLQVVVAFTPKSAGWTAGLAMAKKERIDPKDNRDASLPQGPNPFLAFLDARGARTVCQTSFISPKGQADLNMSGQSSDDRSSPSLTELIHTTTPRDWSGFVAALKEFKRPESGTEKRPRIRWPLRPSQIDTTPRLVPQ